MTLRGHEKGVYTRALQDLLSHRGWRPGSGASKVPPEQQRLRIDALPHHRRRLLLRGHTDQERCRADLRGNECEEPDADRAHALGRQHHQRCRKHIAVVARGRVAVSKGVVCPNSRSVVFVGACGGVRNVLELGRMLLECC